MPTLDAPRKSNRPLPAWSWCNPFRSAVCEQCGAKQPRRPFRKPDAWCWKCEELVDPTQVLLGEAGTLVLDWRSVAEHSDPITKLIGLVVLTAVADGAEEIVFEPTADELRITFLVEQVAYELVPPPYELRRAILQVLKAISNLDPHQEAPQSAQFAILLDRGGSVVQIARAEFAPGEFGERVTIRFPGPCRYQPEFKQQLCAAVEALANRESLVFDFDEPTL